MSLIFNQKIGAGHFAARPLCYTTEKWVRGLKDSRDFTRQSEGYRNGAGLPAGARLFYRFSVSGFQVKTIIKVLCL